MVDNTTWSVTYTDTVTLNQQTRKTTASLSLAEQLERWYARGGCRAIARAQLCDYFAEQFDKEIFKRITGIREEKHGRNR